MVALGSCEKDREATKYYTVSARISNISRYGSWSVGDVVCVNGEISTPVEESGTTATFTFVRNPGLPILAVFPSESFCDKYSIAFPSEQKFQSEKSREILAGSSLTESVTMYPVCGMVRIPIKVKGETDGIERIVIRGNKNEDISGSFTLGFNSIGKPMVDKAVSAVDSISIIGCQGSGDYFCVIPPTTFCEGINLILKSREGKEKRFQSVEQYIIKEGQCVSLPEIEADFRNSDNNIVRTYMEMNDGDSGINSHSSVCNRSKLTFIGSSFRRLGEDIIEYDKENKIGVVYPRFIQNSAGEYLMFFHYGVETSWAGNTVAYLKSKNLLDWSFGGCILSPTRMISEDGVTSIIRCYAGPDVVKLQNGDLLLVAATRRLSDYLRHPEDGGLAICLSHDGGKTWTPPSYVFLGNCWEPEPIVLPNGRIQIYYTDASYVPEFDLCSTGSSLIYSDDNGISWLPLDPANNHIHAFRQIRDDSVSPVLFTDQMPAVIVLNGTKKLAAACESNMAKLGSSTNMMLSTACSGNDYDWGEEDMRGVMPVERNNHFTLGSAPQLLQFPSGETVLIFNKTTDGSSKIFYLLGDPVAKNFSSPEKAFPGQLGNGFWGGIFLAGSNVMLIGVGGRKDRTIDIGQMFLNHDIHSQHTSVLLDGYTNEWVSSEALFAGSTTDNQVILRAASSSNRMYFLVEVVGDGIARVDFWINGEKKSVAVSRNGLEESNVNDVKVASKEGITIDGRKGWSSEIAVPLSEIGSMLNFPVNLTIFGEGYNDSISQPSNVIDNLPHICLQ